MFYDLGIGALRAVIATFVLLLVSILLWFVWNVVIGLFHGPTLSFIDVAVVAAIVSVGNWNFSLLQRRAPTAT